ncbi:MAG: non-ribosomal peptide synthetase, partial [Bacillota bacterium]|nr:non-ribosomal peptide synthetase [Bacillota bacterium]
TNSDRVTIGKPIANTQLFIIDENNSFVKDGEIGELCIAGDGLARGYLNDPEKTSEKFIKHPHNSQVLIYKTGDLVKCLPDGELEIMGRNDSQVKIRGYRIELKEIEEILVKYENITGCAVMAMDDSKGHKFIVAYYTSNNEVPVSALREHLALYLPLYMIPSGFVHMESFPLTPNGKLDRKALPRPEITVENNKALPAGTLVEKQILKIWMELLPAVNIGMNDNFFEIGGNSFQIVMMSNMINEIYPDLIEVADIFANPTINQLSAFLEERKNKTYMDMEFELPSIKFPEHFLQDAFEDSAVLCLSIDNSILEHVDFIASSYGISIEAVFISIFLFLISEITEQKVLCASALLENEDKISNITVDFSGVEDLAEVLIQVKNIYENLSDTKCYPLEIVGSIIPDNHKKTGSVLLAIRDIDTHGLTNVFDIIFKINRESDSMSFLLEFNASTYKQSKMKELLNNYLELIQMLLGNAEN